MNKLSSCEIFKVYDKNNKGSITKTIKNIYENIDLYTIDYELYNHYLKIFKSYKYPFSKFVCTEAIKGNIIPVTLSEPKDVSKKPINLPSAIPTFSIKNKTYVDISAKMSYERVGSGDPISIFIKEDFLYYYLNNAFINYGLIKYEDSINGSTDFIKNCSIAYSRLLSRCLDKLFSISAKTDAYARSLFLTSLFCIVTFFGKSIEDAIKFIFINKISNKKDMEESCNVLKNNKIEFNNLSSFLKVYEEEFSDYLPKDSLTIRAVVGMYTSLYGSNSFFALEHSFSFITMILSTRIKMYNDKIIDITIGNQVSRMNKVLTSIFSKL